MAAGSCRGHEHVVDGCADCAGTSGADDRRQGAGDLGRAELAEAYGVSVEALEESLALMAQLRAEDGETGPQASPERDLAVLAGVAAGHVPRVERRGIPLSKVAFWRPTCSCGWAGSGVTTQELAQQVAQRHVASDDASSGGR